MWEEVLQLLAEEEKNNQTMTTDERSQEEQLRTRVGDGNLLPTSGHDTAMQCTHGFTNFGKKSIIDDFTEAFRKAFIEAFKRDGGVCIENSLVESKNATMDEYAEVWNDSAMMKSAISGFLFVGTRFILDGNDSSARAAATFARYLEQWTAVTLQKTQAFICWPKVQQSALDEYTLVKFFRHRIPCSCLDEKYEEVKTITKMGICNNKQCHLPHREVERSKTMYCSRCRCVTYCSRECKIFDWSTHKPDCDCNVEMITKFEATQLK